MAWDASRIQTAVHRSVVLAFALVSDVLMTVVCAASTLTAARGSAVLAAADLREKLPGVVLAVKAAVQTWTAVHRSVVLAVANLLDCQMGA